MTRQLVRSIRVAACVLSLALIAGGLGACSAASTATSNDSTSSSFDDSPASSSSLWDTSTIHDISVTVADSAAYEQMISTYLGSGDKTWISATVTIDGTTFTDVGLKLKGNSTLRGLTEAEALKSSETLPWIIRLDKFTDGQSYDGETELVVRANSTETSLNEAVALQLLEQTGLATQRAIESRFTMNGSDTTLRLVIQNPNDTWAGAVFDEDAGLLYKAEAGGDYSYRGGDPAAYADAFDQEAGDDDLTPLIAFLKFINESDDATFAAELRQHLDVESFATYLAFHDLIDNFDDISGPGNNSYLHYNTTTSVMTVVSWDLNLAFGQRPGGGGQTTARGGPARADGQRSGNAGGGGPSTANVLADRFLANAEFKALYQAATTHLTETLYTGAAAQLVLDQWMTLLKSQATDLVSTDTIDQEASAISSYFA